jgi:hypothetical protein
VCNNDGRQCAVTWKKYRDTLTYSGYHYISAIRYEVILRPNISDTASPTPVVVPDCNDDAGVGECRRVRHHSTHVHRVTPRRRQCLTLVEGEERTAWGVRGGSRGQQTERGGEFYLVDIGRKLGVVAVAVKIMEWQS